MMMADQVSYKPAGKNSKGGSSTPGKKTILTNKEELLKKIKADAKNWE